MSKEILQTRYEAFFAEAGELSPQPVTTKRGTARKELTADSLAASLSRRPIILLGDVGVGKTMFIRHLVTVEAADLFDRAVVLYVDFGNEPALSTEVEAYVRGVFVEQLRTKYDVDIYENSFVRAVYNGDLNRFAKGVHGDLRELDPPEYKKREIAFLEVKTTDTAVHLRASLEHLASTQKQQVVVFLDNVDQRPLQFQEQVFLIAQAIASGWPGTVFVSLRPETFYQSRAAGSISGYLPRVFTIAPPRVDLVLRRRLEFARGRLKNGGAFAFLRDGVTFESSPLLAYIDALIYSLQTNRKLIELIDNLSGGNVRKALAFLTDFVGSGHVDSDKIVKAQEDPEDAGYLVPVHEFVRAIIFGDAEHFDPSTVAIANVFDVSLPDEREHFLVLILLSFVERAGDVGGGEGFVMVGEIFNEGQRLGFLPSQIDEALRRATAKGLLEGSLLGVREGVSARYRLTTIGAYTAKRLVRLFTYVEAMIVDTPIMDPNVRAKIRDVRLIEDRLHQCDIFRTYLDRAWVHLVDRNPGLDWTDVSRDLRHDIEQIAYKTS